MLNWNLRLRILLISILRNQIVRLPLQWLNLGSAGRDVLTILGMSHRILPTWSIPCVLICNVFPNRIVSECCESFLQIHLHCCLRTCRSKHNQHQNQCPLLLQGAWTTGELDRVLAAALPSQPAPKKVRAKVKTLQKRAVPSRRAGDCSLQGRPKPLGENSATAVTAVTADLCNWA
jgi:hypothetical protein